MENLMKRIKILTKAEYQQIDPIDPNVRYFITDLPQSQISNANMTLALTTDRALYEPGDIFICQDSGTYEKGHIYQLNDGKTAWVDITPTPPPAVLTGTTAPTTATEGYVGQFYLDTVTTKLYKCDAIVSGDPVTYTWSEVGGSGEHLHIITIRPATYLNPVTMIIKTNSSTPFTRETLAQWLYNNGYNSESNAYNITDKINDLTHTPVSESCIYKISGMWCPNENSTYIYCNSLKYTIKFSGTYYYFDRASAPTAIWPEILNEIVF